MHTAPDFGQGELAVAVLVQLQENLAQLTDGFVIEVFGNHLFT